MPQPKNPSPFTGKTKVLAFAGILFDLDGTIVDSTDAIVKHWHKLGKDLGVDPALILQTAHGRRSIDTLQLYDPSKANWEYVSHVEGLIPKEFGADAVEVPGAKDLLASLERSGSPWAIVTSGTRPLVTGWLEVMKLAHPQNLVVAEDVHEGKPHPECYQLGKQRLGTSADAAVLVVEDSPAGIRAGKAAGCTVIGVNTTHGIDQLRMAEPDIIIKDLRSIKFIDLENSADSGQSRVTVEVTNPLAALPSLSESSQSGTRI